MEWTALSMERWASRSASCSVLGSPPLCSSGIVAGSVLIDTPPGYACCGPKASASGRFSPPQLQHIFLRFVMWVSNGQSDDNVGFAFDNAFLSEIGRASCREGVYV